MYCVENKIHCRDCKKSVILIIYPNHLKSHGHVNIVLKPMHQLSGSKNTI